MSTINGIGTFHYGADDPRPDGSRITTLFVVFLFFPLVPVTSQRIRKHNITGSQMQIEVLEKLPLRWSQVGRTYLRGWIGVPLVLVGPLVIEGSILYYLHNVRGVQFEGTVLDKIALPIFVVTAFYAVVMGVYLLGRARRA